MANFETVKDSFMSIFSYRTWESFYPTNLKIGSKIKRLQKEKYWFKIKYSSGKPDLHLGGEVLLLYHLANFQVLGMTPQRFEPPTYVSEADALATKPLEQCLK